MTQTTRLTDTELLNRLVAFDTVSHQRTLPIIDFITDYMAEAEIECYRFPNTDGSKVNLLARVGPDADGGLILSGHVDVVPASEPDWSTDPFRLTEHTDRLVGRGSVDMKAFVALAIQAMIEVDSARMRHPLVLLLTYDEELGCLGAAAFARERELPFALPTSAIVGEPTLLRVVRMHKGHLKVRLVTHGRPAHSGRPQLGSNAIEKMGEVIVRLRDLTRSMESQRPLNHEYFAETPYPVLNPALIDGGSAGNIVPERCELTVGIRLLPGQSTEQKLEELRGLASNCRDCTLDVINDSPPMLTEASAPIHRFLCRKLGQTESFGVSYATDAGALRSMGIDCVIWGPGSIDHAHRADEFISKEQFSMGGRLLREVATEWCR